jgi:hypothetical protein
MDTRIARVEVLDRIISSAAAEVHIVVKPEPWDRLLQLRGRLMGPRCVFASTVEVAYHLRPLSDDRKTESETLVARVAIPEPSLWDPISPFLYAGPIELWCGQHRCDVALVRHGLRTLRFGPDGLLVVNGRPLAARAKAMAAACPDTEALELRNAGYNVLVAPVSNATAPLWDSGDRLGFLVIGRVQEVDEETLRTLTQLQRHPCCLGWITERRELPVRGVLPARLLEQFGPID